MFEKLYLSAGRLTEKIASRETPYNTTKPDREARQRLEFFITKGHVKDDAITQILSRVERAESEIKRARLSGLPGKEIRKISDEQVQNLIRYIESRRSETLKKTLAAIDDRAKMHGRKPSADDVQRRLLALEEAKLRHANVDGRQATARLESTAQNRGAYDPVDLLVLGSKSPEASSAADSLREAVPEYLSDPDGVALIGKLESLVDRRPGEITFTVGDVQSVVDVSSLIDPAVLPTAADLKPPSPEPVLV